MKKIIIILLTVFLLVSITGCSKKHIEEIPSEIYNTFKKESQSLAQKENISNSEINLSLLGVREQRSPLPYIAELRMEIDIPNIENGGYTQADYDAVVALSETDSYDLEKYTWVNGKNKEVYYFDIDEIKITSNGSVYTIDHEEKGTKAYSYLRKDGEIVYEWSYVLSIYRGEADDGGGNGNEYDYNGNNEWDSNEWNDALDDYLTEHGY